MTLFWLGLLIGFVLGIAPVTIIVAVRDYRVAKAADRVRKGTAKHENGLVILDEVLREIVERKKL